MEQKPTPDWPERVRAAMVIADVRGEKATMGRGGKGYDRTAGLGKRLKMSEATLNRRLRETTWENYELEALLHRVADAVGLPYSFFTVPNLREIVSGGLEAKRRSEEAPDQSFLPDDLFPPGTETPTSQDEDEGQSSAASP